MQALNRPLFMFFSLYIYVFFYFSVALAAQMSSNSTLDFFITRLAYHPSLCDDERKDVACKFECDNILHLRTKPLTELLSGIYEFRVHYTILYELYVGTIVYCTQTLR